MTVKIGLPRSVRGQLILVLLGSLLAAQCVGISFFAHDRDRLLLRLKARDVVETLLHSAWFFNEVSPEIRNQSLNLPAFRDFRLTVTEAPSAVSGDRKLSGDLAAHVAAELNLLPIGQFHVSGIEDPDVPQSSPLGGLFHDDRYIIEASVLLEDGLWLNVRDAILIGKPWAGPSLTSLLVTGVIVIAVVWLIVAKITKPLYGLSRAVQLFGSGKYLAKIPPTGPSELKNLVYAFNDMSDRLTRLLTERAQTLATIGHDLRSPITAMRLRVELLDEGDSKDRLFRCLDEIESLVQAALALAKGADTTEPTTVFSLDDMLEEIAEELVEVGGDVVVMHADNTTISARRAALKRAVRNLAENALRYGHQARFYLYATGQSIKIMVDDDGPGIPVAERERVFDPFVRLEESRSRATGGSGIGLTLARKIVEAHHGTIHFEEPETSGARAIVCLPRGEQLYRT